MRKSICCLLCLLLAGSLGSVQAQIDARMFQYPDVSQTHITFVYAGDIWVVDKTGGTAQKLSAPDGSESYPRFSPDGSRIAFSGNYHGNTDVYVIPVQGGLPKRLTYHGFFDRVVDWHPDGTQVLFASSRESERQRFNQFFLVSLKGGMAEKLPLPYAEFGSFAQNGNQIVYTDKSRLTRTWKRYRGGMAPDLTLFNLENLSSQTIAGHVANDEVPMWKGDMIYFLSDRGSNQRHNLYSYNTTTEEVKQLTRFSDFDIHFPSMGPEEIVFEAGGKLYLFDLQSEKASEVNISVLTDQLTLAPRMEKAQRYIQHMQISPDGKRAIVEARGELFSVPAEHGFVKNLTQTSGVAERYPAWSPDGASIAFWSDKSGEYELYLLDCESGKEEKLTSYGSGFRYQMYWSPDSRKLAFVDQAQKIQIYDRDQNKTLQVDKGLWMMHGPLEGFAVSWSADSRWMAYDRSLESSTSTIFLYDTENQSRHQVTSGYYNDANPTFDPDGKYLYFTTDRHFSPVYSDMDGTFIYPNATQIAAVSLRNDVPSPLAPRNDEVAIKKEEDKKEDKDGEKKEEEKKEDEEKEETLVIDLDNFEERLVLLPMKPGNYGRLHGVKGKLVFQKAPNSGAGGGDAPIKYFDLKERETKTIVEDANGYRISADGKKMLVSNNGKTAIVSVQANQKMDKALRLDEMEMWVDPKAEWKQIFADAWRLERDYFYDKDMHGVDWASMKKQYGDLIDDAVTRWDVNYVLGELIGELNASHTYRGGGDTEQAKQRSVGYLGVDWEVANGHYRIKEIVKAASWDAEVRSPFSQPGVMVEAGDYVLAVNGQPLSITREPYAAFEGLAGKTVELTIGKGSPDEKKTVIVETLRSETRLRHLAWIEHNRKRVEEATGGQVGYVYVRSTGIDGQNELVRQYNGQIDKKAMIIDERFNSGGQIPDRFVELLNRKPLAYWSVRDGQDWSWPVRSNLGPKVMLINGWSGSGGDAFPDYFRKAGVGELIGTRTWGGLIGISGAPQLIDGGVVTVPTFRMYDPDGTWFKEGHGVDPDIEVKENPTELAKGTDVQLEKAIEVIKGKLGKPGNGNPDTPAQESRTK